MTDVTPSVSLLGAYRGKYPVMCKTCTARFWGKTEDSARDWLCDHHCREYTPTQRPHRGSHAGWKD